MVAPEPPQAEPPPEPPPHAEPPPEPQTRPDRARRERGWALVLALLGAVLGLLSSSRTWVSAQVEDDLAGRLAVQASGRQAAPVVAAVCLVALAAAVAVLIGRRLGRTVSGALLVLAGAAATTAAVSTARSPLGAVAVAVSRPTGRPGAVATDVRLTAWPWVAVAGGLLMVVAGVLVVLRARRWAAPSQRYEAPAAQVPSVDDDDPRETWNALTRGDDPTR